MASALPAFPSTKETTNYARLCRLLVDVGSQALRDTFDGIHPPAGLHGVLTRHPEHATLQTLRKKKILNATQWGKLYPTIPSSVSSASFDITLLVVLLRNICGLHAPITTGWDRLPLPTDTSTEANIARVKYYRNTVYGHAGQASVDDATFNTYWQDISNALVALGGASYGAAISNLNNECMDPDMEEHYRELLKQWKKDEDSIKDKLEEIEDKIRKNIEQLKERLDSFIAQWEGTNSEDKDETRDDLNQMKSEIQNISEKLNSQMSQRVETAVEESTRENLRQMKAEIGNINEKLDSLMNRLPPVKKKPRIGDVFDPAELIDGIRQLYKTRERWLAPFPWCEEFHFDLDNIYTRLKVVSRKKERGTVTADTVNMSGIFKPHEECPQPRTVLIEGEPGMGKTTYCQKLVYDWATGKQEAEDCFPRFETVLLLRCRDMKSDLWEAIDDQLLPRDVTEDVKETFFNFIRDNQSDVLLVLDGLDEVPAKKLPMFSEIIQGRVLPKCRVVATARHEAGKKVRKQCDTLLEIKGFTKDDAEKFIVKYFKNAENLRKELLLKLQNDENLETLAVNPLNAALLCLVCEECQGTFPDNKSQLFLEMVQCILRRYRKKEGLPESEHVLIEVYKTQLKHLGRIALKGLQEDELDFEESKLANHSSDLPKFGFLSVSPGGSKLRPCLRYSFLHKRFQEWFAAFYLCCQLVEGESSPDKLVNELSEVQVDHKLPNFPEVYLFVFGILAGRDEELAVALIKSIAKLATDGDEWLLLAVQCFQEFFRDNNKFFLKLARGFGSSFEREGLRFIEYDLCDMEFDGSPNHAAFVVLAEALKVNTTVESICFTGPMNEGGTDILKDILKNNSTLTELWLDECHIGDDGASDLADALKVNTTLTELKMPCSNIGDDGDDGAADLADALKINTTLTDLILSSNNIGDYGAARLAGALRVNTALTKLDLGWNGIGNRGTARLADALEVNTILTELILSSNEIGPDGAARLAGALRVNTTLTKLDLELNGIGNLGTARLADALEVNTILTELILSSNKIGPDGAARLAGALRVNTTLTKLDLELNGIGNFGIDSLADALKSNTNLKKLNLSQNNIDKDGFHSLANALKSNTYLKELDLSGNKIDWDGLHSLVDAIEHNTTLDKMYLTSYERFDFHVDPASIDDPRDKAVATELLRLRREGRVFFNDKLKILRFAAKKLNK
ncbi:uncharacterized protein LOC144638800 isoform X2 [Oculina patagonica]